MTTHFFTAKDATHSVIVIIMMMLVSNPLWSTSIFPLSAHVAYAADNGIRTNSSNNSDVVILSVTTKYDQDLSAFHVFGEILNNLTDSVITDIRLNVTFYDSSGNAIHSAYGNTFIETLRPLEKSGFDIATYGDLALEVENFSYYKMAKSWLVVKDSKPGLLSLLVDHMTIDSCGYYHVGGFVGNLGPELTKDFIISGSFYNEWNQVVTSTFTTPTIKAIKSGSFSPYEFIIESNGILPHFASYSLNAQSADYATKIGDHLSQLSSLDNNIKEGGTSVSTSVPPASTTPATSGSMITVFTDLPRYRSDIAQVKVFGKVVNYSHNNRAEEPITVVRIISGSGEQLYKATTTISEDGHFSKIMEFQTSEASEAQIYRIRAEYNGMTAENTFIVESNNGNIIDNNNSISSQICKDGFARIPIQQLFMTSHDSGDDEQIDYELPQNPITVIEEVKVHSQVNLSVKAENKLSMLQPAVTVLEVLDSNDNVVFLRLQNNVILPNSNYQINIPWTPEDVGDYQVKSFIISGLEEPVILSTPVTASLRVIN